MRDLRRFIGSAVSNRSKVLRNMISDPMKLSGLPENSYFRCPQTLIQMDISFHKVI